MQWQVQQRQQQQPLRIHSLQGLRRLLRLASRSLQPISSHQVGFSSLQA